MMVKSSRFAGLVAVNCCSMALVSGVRIAGADTIVTPSDCVSFSSVADGVCDMDNNNETCDYDGGDCCECTCVADEDHPCDGAFPFFECRDPSAPCSDNYHDRIKLFPDYAGADVDVGSFSYSYPLCLEECIGDGQCNSEHNVEECDYDGGDCCECDCTSTTFHTCGDTDDGSAATGAAYDCIDPASACVDDGYVEAAEKTVVAAFSSGFDTFCMDGAGCKPALMRDGDIVDEESRWSCHRNLFVDGGATGECWVEFFFESPQDIKDVQVAFWDADDDAGSRTINVSINSVAIGEFASSPGAVFTSLGIEEDNVSFVGMKALGLEGDEYLGILEVRFLMDP